MLNASPYEAWLAFARAQRLLPRVFDGVARPWKFASATQHLHRVLPYREAIDLYPVVLVPERVPSDAVLFSVQAAKMRVNAGR